MAVISKRSRGSVNDMLAAMKDALQQNVDSSTAVEGSINYKGYTIEYNKEFKSYDIFDDYDLLYAQDVPSIADAKSRIDQEVDASMSTDNSKVMAADELDSDYIYQLADLVVDKIHDQFYVDDIVFHDEIDMLYCTVTYDGQILDFEIPYEDLTMDELELDANYISNSIIDSIK